MPGDALFAPLTTTDALLAATGDQAWLQAMLDAEAALAAAEADCGVIPAAAADAIAASCRAERFDVGQLGHEARASANPVIPLVQALRREVPEHARSWVHHGATSQDVLDTAASLVAAASLDLVAAELAGLAEACAALAERHRSTPMLARTLLQPALPTTFGLKAAGWLLGVHDAAAAIATARGRLASQLGGAVGTLAALGPAGLAVAAAFAHRLGLPEPVVPWHAARQRIAEVGCACALAAATAAKVTTDVALLMQAEVGEAAEPAAPGRGGSSAMPQKRNPVAAAEAGAAARRAAALVPVLLGAVVAEHERGLGGWQAEWQPLSELLALAGGAAARAREVVEGLEVHPDAMAANLRSHPSVMAEAVVTALLPVATREEATEAVRRASADAADAASFQAALEADAVASRLGPDGIAAALRPASYLGAAEALVDRALADHARRRR